jgi:hypothetical protein
LMSISQKDQPELDGLRTPAQGSRQQGSSL